MGLLDWLTDGSLTGGMMGGMGQAGSSPLVDATNNFQPPGSTPLSPAEMSPPPPPPAAAMPPPDPTPAAGPPDPPVDPSTSDIAGGMQGAGSGQPPIPMPAPRPPGADAAPPPPSAPLSLAPPGGGTNGVGPGLGVGAPPMPPPATPSPLPGVPAAGGDQPYKLGDQTALGRALGIDPHSSAFKTIMAGIGSGLSAAGNSKGKSAGQAFASGAGATLEGSAKEAHAADKDAQGYLTAAISAKRAGDDATYKTNYTAYLAAKLKSEQAATASKDAAGNKMDSPTQLYLSAQRNVAADPLVKGALNAYQNALKTGNGPADPEVQKAKAAYEQTVQERQAAHLAGVGLHPQTAAQIAQQPGMTQANPLDAGKAGITASNIGQKLQPGQYYKNPADGKIYQFKGSPTKSGKKSAVTPAVSAPEPADPMNPNKVPASASADAE